jgi:hypothetical protein
MLQNGFFGVFGVKKLDLLKNSYSGKFGLREENLRVYTPCKKRLTLLFFS